MKIDEKHECYGCVYLNVRWMKCRNTKMAGIILAGDKCPEKMLMIIKTTLD